ncbi:hypothetical protein L228DRAFT_269881 [Xylona heveae TC161]|uniref:ER membrane protein complex subunit 7 beta-sandwich domain-containing protein n=1 Tax=Xylona heveae (strain CBS 132557 / TC161) TaxID=1328760 RepID=A0A165AJF5_XYLHT|nr:hypothetical protein L228DRAFT_269881 [Xylona heveae TC161]KZF20578.1 hypothetical protein L228DRAFT_269881 [Xylona heveae TC161]
MRFLTLSAAALSFAASAITTATAASTILRVAVPSTSLLPNPGASLPASTKLTLTTLGKDYEAPISRDGTFTLRNVEEGSYLLSVACLDYIFPKLRVDIGGDVELVTTEAGSPADAGIETKVQMIKAWQTFPDTEWANTGETQAVDPISLAPLVKKEYYVKREGFSPLSLLRNPMILLGLASLGLIFGMPKVMDNLDPEMKAELEEQRRNGMGSGSSAAAASFQNFDMAAWLAGKNSNPSAESSSDSRKSR